MNTSHTPSRLAMRDRIAAGICAAVAIVFTLALASCGGGSSTAGVGTGGTGYASGPVTGLASVIVGGVDFDDTTARLRDDDDLPLLRDDIKLGMTVEIDSDTIRRDATGQAVATASRIQLRTLALGPVDSIDAPGHRVQVLGQWMGTDSRTVYDPLFNTRLASLTAGQVVVVHGLLGADGRYRATRIAPVLRNVALYRLRAVVSAVDRSNATLTADGVVYSTQGLSLPAAVAPGARVALLLGTSRDASARWVVRGISVLPIALADGAQMRVEGLVDAFTDSRHFSINGVPVDAGSATLSLGNGTLQLGSRVEVEGTATAGTLRAATVKLDDGGGGDEIRLRGPLSSLDTTSQTFVVRQSIADYSALSPSRIENGTLADLPTANATGRSVEVRGVLSNDGTRLVVQRLKFL